MIADSIVARGATLSECERYRYRLWRKLHRGSRRMLFVMLNPSTADGLVDDPTVRRCVGFAEREGCSFVDVVNLYAWRSPSPIALRLAADPVGPDNDTHISEALAQADIVVCAWGADGGPVEGRAAEVSRVLAPYAPFCLGLTTKRAPRHPLYVRADAPLRSWGSL